MRFNRLKILVIVLLLQLFNLENALAQCQSEYKSFAGISKKCVDSFRVKLNERENKVKVKNKEKYDAALQKAKDKAIAEGKDPSDVQVDFKSASSMRLVIPKDGEKIKGDTYLFKTSTGRFGKFLVRSYVSTPKSCDLSLDIITYIDGNANSPTGSFSIERKFGAWTKDTAGFDARSVNDFSLSNYRGQCVLTAEGATAFKYTRIKQESLIKGRDLLAQAGLVLIFLAVFLVARQVFQDEDRYKAQSTLEDAEKDEEKNDFSNDIVLKYSRPFFKRYFTPVVQGMKNKKKIRDKYKRKLASAGMTKVLTPEDVYAFKLFLIIGFPILFLGLRQFLEESWPLTIVPIISVIGFKYPDIWLNGKIAKRKESIINGMPFIVDMLALAVEAGLDFMAAIHKVVEKAPPSALADEFEILMKETKIGASRAEGLRQLAWRTDTIEISSFTATLIAADSVGASIGPILKTLAAEMRQKRSAEAEKKGATAATKILFPMMFLIMPAVAIVIMAPIGLQMMGGGGM